MYDKLPHLARRLSRALTGGRGIHLSAEDLDLLVVTGAYEKLQQANTDHLREVSKSRLASREAPKQVDPSVASAMAHETADRLKRTRPDKEAQESFERLQRTLKMNR